MDATKQITSLEELRVCIQNSVLIAIDVDGGVELGLAIRSVGLHLPPLEDSHKALKAFANHHDIEVYSVYCGSGKRRTERGREKLNQTVRGFQLPSTQMGTKVLEIVASYPAPRVLIAYSAAAENAWIKTSCPVLAAMVDVWADVQDFASERGDTRHMGLTDANERYGFNASRSVNSRAHKDAVRIQRLLQALLTTDDFAQELPHRVTIYNDLSRDVTSKFYPYELRVTTADGSTLPRSITHSRKLAEHFQQYNLDAAAMNCHRRNCEIRGVRHWWLAFRYKADLERFIDDIDGSTMEGVVLMLTGADDSPEMERWAATKCRRRQHRQDVERMIAERRGAVGLTLDRDWYDAVKRLDYPESHRDKTAVNENDWIDAMIDFDMLEA